MVAFPLLTYEIQVTIQYLSLHFIAIFRIAHFDGFAVYSLEDIQNISDKVCFRYFNRA